MNQMKNRLQGLTLLDRAFTAMTDDELEALVASLPEDHRTALDEICGAREGGFTEPSTRTLAMRATAARGRLNGGLEQITTLLCDPCLADCIEALGDSSDNPTEDELLEATPALDRQARRRHGAADDGRIGRRRSRRLGRADPPVEARRDAGPAARRARRGHRACRRRRPTRRSRPSARPPRLAKQADAKARREQQARARHGS